MDTNMKETDASRVEAGRAVQKGAWVCREDNRALGQVRDAYSDEEGAYLDIVLYSPSGERIGRESPAMGGPTSFEPACPARYWICVEAPRFPVATDLYGEVIRSGSRLATS